jgi:hypothetical protein
MAPIVLGETSMRRAGKISGGTNGPGGEDFGVIQLQSYA